MKPNKLHNALVTVVDAYGEGLAELTAEKEALLKQLEQLTQAFQVADATGRKAQEDFKRVDADLTKAAERIKSLEARNEELQRFVNALPKEV